MGCSAIFSNKSNEVFDIDGKSSKQNGESFQNNLSSPLRKSGLNIEYDLEFFSNRNFREVLLKKLNVSEILEEFKAPILEKLKFTKNMLKKCECMAYVLLNKQDPEIYKSKENLSRIISQSKSFLLQYSQLKTQSEVERMNLNLLVLVIEIYHFLILQIEGDSIFKEDSWWHPLSVSAYIELKHEQISYLLRHKKEVILFKSENSNTSYKLYRCSESFFV